MESKAKLLGHPIHPMLVVFPLGLLSLAVLFDALYLALGNDELAVVAFWNITAGLIGGLAAALFGLVDWLAIPGGTRAKRVGAWHGLGNAVVVLLFVVSWSLRLNQPVYGADVLPFVLGLVAVGIALITAWLGGELVYRLRVGVDDIAGLDAPSSLGGPVPGREDRAREDRTRDEGRPARLGQG
jgi:uncharacterized membrane protein